LKIIRKLAHKLARESQDGLARHVKGVRTSAERTQRQEQNVPDYIHPDAVKTDIDFPDAIITKDRETGETTVEFAAPPTITQIDPNTGSSYLVEEQLAVLRDIIRCKRGRVADRYVRFMDYYFAGTPKQEMAALEGVSELRVNHLCQRVRDDLKTAPELIQLSLKILETLSDKKATQAQLEADLPSGDELLSTALGLLLRRGLTERTPEGYVPTGAGILALREQTLA